MLNKGSSYFWADRIRIFAPFFVMLLHASAQLVAQFGQVRADWWYTAYFMDVFARPCVPLYVMLSGCFILNRDYTIPKFFKKRVLRVLLPFIFWSILLTLGNIVIFKKTYVISHFPMQFFTEPIYYHLWYVYMLMSLYLITPVLRGWIVSMGSNYAPLHYFIATWFIVSTIIPIFTFVTGKYIAFQTQYVYGFIGYYVLGYYIGNCTIPISRNRQNWYAFIMWLVGFLFTAIAVYVHSTHSGKLNEFFFDNLQPNLILMSVGMFVLFKNLIPEGIEGRKTKLIKNISYGLYLSHGFVLDIIRCFWIDHTFIHPIIAIPIMAILCFIICTALIYAIRKIPYGKYITG